MFYLRSLVLWILFSFALAKLGVNIVDTTGDYLLMYMIVMGLIINEKFQKHSS